MDRRSFVKQAGLVTTWLGISIVLHGCSDDDDNPMTPTPDPQPGDISGVISNNHSHAVIITGAQITAASAVTLTMAGGTHTHTVTLSADQVESIAAGTTTQATSSNDAGHTHSATFN